MRLYRFDHYYRDYCKVGRLILQGGTLKVPCMALVMLLMGGISAPRSLASQSLEGHWEGAISIQGLQLGIQVDFKADQQGLKGTINIPQQGAKGLALKEVRFEAPKVHFELPAGPGLAVFDGEFKKDEISGSFIQGPSAGTFSLKRGTASKEIPPAEEPVPYKQEEVRFTNGAVTLSGTLTLPVSGGPSPAVVLITGSGAQNRDEEILGFKVFRLIAERCFRSSFPQPRRSKIECRLRRRATRDQVRADLSSISLRRSLKNEKLSAENRSMWSR